MKKLLCVVLMGMVFFTACSNESASNSEGNATEETTENNQNSDTDDKVNAEYEAYAKRLLELSDYMPQFEAVKSGDMLAVISTNMGDITVKLFPEEAPKAVENFVTHGENGYFDNLLFHRVIEGFMNQTGDPNGDSTGGESIWGEPFEDEFSPYMYQFNGALAMANSGINTNGSQFYIVTADEINEGYADGYFGYVDSVIEEYGSDNILTNAQTGKIFRTNYSDAVREKYNEVGGTPFLDYGHTVFGQVVYGMDVVNAINTVETDSSDKPLEDIIITGIEIKTAE